MSKYSVEYKDNRPYRLLYSPSYSGTVRHVSQAAEVAKKLIAKNHLRDIDLFDYREGTISVWLDADNMEQGGIMVEIEQVQAKITALVDRIQETLAIMEAIKDE